MRITTLSALMLGAVALSGGAQAAGRDSSGVLDTAVMSTLQECQQMFSSCASTTQNALGVLVFPSVVKADLLIGGAGGKGALVENGKITGHYRIGAASAGLQAGIEKSSQIYVFRSPDALAQLKQSQDWKVGASAGVTVVNADTNASAVTGDVLAYVFDSKGLNAGVSLDVFDVWKAGHKRPQPESAEAQ